MAVLIQAGRQFAYAVAVLMAKGEGSMEASLVKAYVCKAAEWVTREAMQIHGGMGYAEEFPVSRLFVDARVLSIFEGADELLCMRVIARQLSPPPDHRLTAPSSGGELVGEVGERADPLEVGVGMIVVRVDEDRVEPGAARRRDVHRHRVADVGDATAVELGEVRRGRGRRSPGRAWRRRRRGCR